MHTLEFSRNACHNALFLHVLFHLNAKSFTILATPFRRKTYYLNCFRVYWQRFHNLRLLKNFLSAQLTKSNKCYWIFFKKGRIYILTVKHAFDFLIPFGKVLKKEVKDGWGGKKGQNKRTHSVEYGRQNFLQCTEEILFNNTNTSCNSIFTLWLMTCLEKEAAVTRLMCMYLTQQSLSYISRETTIAPVSTCLTHRCYNLYLQDCLPAWRPFVVKGISHCDYRHIKSKESRSLIFLTSICLVATSQV